MSIALKAGQIDRPFPLPFFILNLYHNMLTFLGILAGMLRYKYGTEFFLL